MRTSRAFLGIPLLCAALGAGCEKSANDRAADIRAAQDNRGGSGQVLLTGCVATASGTDAYVLRNVRIAPAPEQPSDAAPRAVEEGSWVRLRANDRDELRNHVGQVVQVTGTITDDGRDTIGTGGPAAGPNEPQSRTDRSRAASPERHSERVREEAGPMGQQSLANGTAPEIVVHRIIATGDSCVSR